MQEVTATRNRLLQQFGPIDSTVEGGVRLVAAYVPRQEDNLIGRNVGNNRNDNIELADQFRRDGLGEMALVDLDVVLRRAAASIAIYISGHDASVRACASQSHGYRPRAGA